MPWKNLCKLLTTMFYGGQWVNPTCQLLSPEKEPSLHIGEVAGWPPEFVKEKSYSAVNYFIS
jgi:hypothetical protein